jgi:carboxyl-terminal processing protease
MYRSRLLLAALVPALAIFALGLWLGGHPEKLPQFLRDAFVDDQQAVHAEVIDKVRTDFYRPVTTEQLEQSSLRGIVQSLHDPYSRYMSPSEARRFTQDVHGQFEGIGLSVRHHPRGLEVTTVFDGSPAKQAGIAPGDLIVKANGESLAGETTDTATSKIKGPAGTSVTLTILKGGKGPARTIKVQRKKLDIPLVEGKLVTRSGTKLGVDQLSQFSDGVHGKLRAEIDKQLKSGAKGIVLDLRGNPGGLLQEGRLVASIFVPKGLIVSTKGRNSPEAKYNAIGGAISPKVPVIVLVDRGSASASEITTGALKDHHRATVVGTRTFGKGVFQEVETLSNGGLLDLTVGRYFLPNGENIQKTGIEPDVRAKDDPKTKPDEALDKALAVLREKTG